ncbi:hypothetical protein AMTR_s00459p00001440 [Amborella trichopoda]|uniref:Uncharacterized protein n=1 Tax=Amborella trichopoda TaxID=13333 RepID=W1P5W2_AMBTC|nr:hypothetical protein AMTR_s00459p00001440 [Amborella trichopoda]
MNITTTRDVNFSDSVDFFANKMATSITLDLQTHERAYLYIFHALEGCIPSQIVHGLSWEIACRARVEAISRNEPNVQMQLRFFIDVKQEREIVEGEHPEPETEFEAPQQEDEILEEEIDETATELKLELRHFMEFSSQERYIFRGDYQQMETNDLELLRGIEASSQMECPPRPAADQPSSP